MNTEVEWESPFDRLEQQHDANRKLEDLLEHLKGLFKVTFAGKLIERLRFLRQMAQEEAPEQGPLSPDSLKFFVSFMYSHSKFRYPEVVLSPTGNLRAEWRVSANKYFAVEFLATGDCRFVTFAPNKRHPEKIIRLSGTVSADLVVETVKPHGVLSWSTAG